MSKESKAKVSEKKVTKVKVDKKKVTIAVIIVALLAVIGVLSYFLLKGKDAPVIERGQPVEEKIDMKVEVGSTAIPVAGDFEVSKSQNPSVNVYNPSVNKDRSYLSYEFIDKSTGKVICKTNLIEAGSTIPVNIGDLLDVGEYNVTLNTYSYSYDNPKEGKNGGTSDIVVKVTD